MEPDKGKILISAPFLDDVFKKSIILLTEHNENGSVGFILNKSTEYKVNDVLEDFPVIDSKVYLGGPVQTEIINFIHNYGDLISDSYEICNGIYWGGNFESLKFLIENKNINPNNIKFFLGYSGWGAGQLANELKQYSWYVNRISNNEVFNDAGEEMWKNVLKKMGGKYAIISNFPENPSLN